MEHNGDPDPMTFPRNVLLVLSRGLARAAAQAETAEDVVQAAAGCRDSLEGLQRTAEQVARDGVDWAPPSLRDVFARAAVEESDPLDVLGALQAAAEEEITEAGGEPDPVARVIKIRSKLYELIDGGDEVLRLIGSEIVHVALAAMRHIVEPCDRWAVRATAAALVEAMTLEGEQMEHHRRAYDALAGARLQHFVDCVVATERSKR